ncbi:Wall-associated receptor kinase 2 [Morella rubra]|uniref:Wall-associated receptor kinase 2 n=1 Tax=Morella rubra TaxID=262757 RepID=A0A6A1VAR3_9ROSI|nr:Wall-associated receptor kinase 2 [Morella rubra]
MALLGILSQLSLLIGAIIVAASAASHPNSGCNRTCGSLEIPYPFGTSEGCYLDEFFLITCNLSYEPPRPLLRHGDLEVLNISLDGEITISAPVARDCYSQSGQSDYNGTLFYNDQGISLLKFRISSKRNKITAVGCDTYSYIQFYNEDKYYTTGCLSLCDPISSVKSGSCTGIGCCQTSIPEEAMDEKAYKFSTADLKDLQNRTSLPLVLDWTVGNETCRNAKKNRTSFACKANMSTCHNSASDSGYICKCSEGFQGNPYLRNGCEDINECKASNPCITTCVNTPGSYKCYCHKGFEGDGLRNGTGCSRKDIKYMNTIISIPLGKPENETNLANYFVSLAKEDQLFQILENDILEEGNIEEVKQVADIAKRCLGVRKEDRPTMKEVAMELEGLGSMNRKHLSRKADVGLEKTEYLLSSTTILHDH